MVARKLLFSALVPVVTLLTAHIGLAQELQNSQCFERLSKVSSPPLETYNGTGTVGNTYIQVPGKTFGLSDNAKRLLNGRTRTVRILALCDGNVVAVWEPETFGKFPVYLSGRILDKTGTPISEEFGITERDETQVLSGIARLSDDRFVVIWAGSRKQLNQIRTRIFRADGVPLTKSLTLTESKRIIGHHVVSALPRGRFLLSWYRLGGTVGDGAYFQIRGTDAKPITDEVRVVEDDGLGGFIPRPWIETDGSFTLFIETSGRLLTEPSALSYGRRYSASGEPLTPLVKGDAVTDLPGYQDVVESLTYEMMGSLEYTLREYVTGDVMGFRFCDMAHSAQVLLAQRIKSLTQDARKRAFLTNFCQQRLTHCGRIDYNGELHDQCASED